MARPLGLENDLHELLRRWFGATAGHPGTEHFVNLRSTAMGRVLEPAGDRGNEVGGERRLTSACQHLAGARAAIQGARGTSGSRRPDFRLVPTGGETTDGKCTCIRA